MRTKLTRWIAVILVLAAFAALMPTAFAAQTPLAKDTFSFTVGKGTRFDYIGLPETVYREGKAIATCSWNQGNYNGDKAGTYTITGTASLKEGGSTAVKAIVTVKDCGFRLPPMEEFVGTRQTLRSNRVNKSESFQRVQATPLFDTNVYEDYTWNYRWYITDELGVPGKLYSTTKDCELNFDVLHQYYYGKITGTKDGVSTTLTTRYFYVDYQTYEDLMHYNIISNRDEVAPGDEVKLLSSLALAFRDGAFDQYYFSGVDDYITHFNFSCDVPGVTFSQTEVVAPRGIADVTVQIPENVTAQQITFNAHITTVSVSAKYYKGNLKIDYNATLTLPVVEKLSERKISDVTNEWYADGVRYMLENGYMGCKTKDTFDANAYVTRGDLAIILYRIAGFENALDFVSTLRDLPSDEPYVYPVLWANSKNIINGTTKWTFSPDKLLTRQEFITILHRYTGRSTLSADMSQFSDTAKISDYAKQPMQWAVNIGLIEGNGGKIDPQGTLTRAQVATILARYFDK